MPSGGTQNDEPSRSSTAPSGSNVPLVDITSRPSRRLAAVARTAARWCVARGWSPGAVPARGTAGPVANADRSRVLWAGRRQRSRLPSGLRPRCDGRPVVSGVNHGPGRVAEELRPRLPCWSPPVRLRQRTAGRWRPADRDGRRRGPVGDGLGPALGPRVVEGRHSVGARLLCPPDSYALRPAATCHLARGWFGGIRTRVG